MKKIGSNCKIFVSVHHCFRIAEMSIGLDLDWTGLDTDYDEFC